MRVLIGCEYSGRTREAFAKLGHDAWSCDLLPSNIPGKHIQGNLLSVLGDGWDLMIAHPDCTYLAVSGIHWNKNNPERQKKTDEAMEFVKKLWYCGIPRICIENPVSVISTRLRPPDQIIQPWQFGDDASKKTCLWLRGLRPLKPTNILPGGHSARRANQTQSGQNNLPPSPMRKKLRSITYQGIANAMAEQWSFL